MMYFIHPSGAFAAVEDADRAGRYIERGYVVCNHATFRAAWRARDAGQIAERIPAPPQPRDDPPAAPVATPSPVPMQHVYVPPGWGELH